MLNSSNTQEVGKVFTGGSRTLIYGVVVLPVLILFALSWTQPFHVDGDVGYSAKTAMQFVRGEVGNVNTLRLADPADLSRDVYIHISWWPPGICVLFIILLKLGLSIGSAARFLMIVSGIAGAVGWVRVALLLGLSPPWAYLSALPVSAYVLQSGMAYGFTTGDPLVFCLAPYLIVLCLTEAQSKSIRTPKVALLGLMCGGLYCIKYSSVFLIISLTITLLWSLLRTRRTESLLRRLSAATWFVGGAGLPVIGVYGFNHASAGGMSAILAPTMPPLTGIPFIEGTLKQFGNVILDIEPGIDRLTGILHSPPYVGPTLMAPFVLLLGWLLWTALCDDRMCIGVFSVLSVVVPIGGLSAMAYVGAGIELNDAIRYFSAHWILISLMFLRMVSVGLGNPLTAGDRRIVFGRLIAIVGVVFWAWIPASYGKQWLKHLGQHYNPTENNLYVRNLSLAGDPHPLLEAVRASIEERSGVVVPAFIGTAQETWLELDERLAPQTHFWRPLSAYETLANYASNEPFLSRKPLRIVLISSNIRGNNGFEGELLRLKARFPQAHLWRRVFNSATDASEVWVSDLSQLPIP